MEEFNLLGHHNPKPSLSQMDLFNNLEGFNLPLSSQGFSHDHQIPLSFHDEIPRSVGPIFDPMVHFFPSGNTMNLVHEPEIQVSSSPPSDSGTTGFLGPGKVNYKKQQVQNYGGKKRKRISERAIEKPREVVHVRAKRGQATDSHSLAERLRREKINEKLRCLQDLVPGCYKTMGMAVMLDVIINYVRSLQNQIDFLSMKLSAASLFYDFNSSEAEAMETLQGTSGYETAQGMEKLVGEAYEGTSHFQTVPWPL